MMATNGNIWMSTRDTSWVILVQQRDIRVCHVMESHGFILSAVHPANSAMHEDSNPAAPHSPYRH